MNATLNYPTAQTPARKAPERKYAGYLLFILCASLYILPFMRVFLQQTDEGLLVSDAVRVAHGQVFARDFVEILGPGTFYWLAFFFKLFGITFLATRIYLFVSSLGTGLLMYFLSRRVCGRYQTLPCVVLAATYCGMLWPTISHHVDSNFFALASVACMVVWQQRRNRSLLIAAGVLAGATTFFHQPKGILLAFALLLWLAVQYLRRSTSRSSLALVSSGYIGAIAIGLAYFWSRHALRDFIYVSFVWPYGHYEAANVVPYAQGIIREYWNGWAGPMGGMRWRAGVASLLIIPFALVAALPVLLPILGFPHRKTFAKPEILLYWLCGWALWLSEIHRKDISHLVFGSPLLIILCVYYLERYRAKVADLALQLLVVSAIVLAGFNFLLVMFAHPMPTRVGSVAVFRDDPVLTALDARTTPGQEIFVYPFNPIYYFFSETTNPTRYTGLGYNYNSAAEFQGVVRTLDQHHVRYVLWDAGAMAKAYRDQFASLKPPRPDQLIMEPYLESHYKTVWTDNKGILLMERNGESQ